MDIDDIANAELRTKLNSLFQEKNSLWVQIEKLAAGLVIANEKLSIQNKEKEERAAELVLANKELAFQIEQKEKRAAELVVANKELAFQNDEKEKRAAELGVANKELLFQNDEKEKRAAELVVANKELAFQNDQKEKRAAELVLANKELAFQNDQKEKRAAELVIANKELDFQHKQKEKRAAELVVANKELGFQNDQKEKRAAELAVANKELGFQNDQKEKRAAELVVANKELAFQNEEKEKRAAELIVAKEKSELYLDMAGSAFVSLDQKGNILLVNQKCLEILEYDKSEELKGKNWFDTCIPSEINKEVKEDYSKVMKGKVELVEYFENEVVTKSGKRRLIYWNNSLIKDEDGQINELLSSGIDITERKYSEEALAKIKDEFHLLAESMPQIVWITLSNGMNIYFNQQWVEYTGLTLEESYGEGWIKPFHPEDQQRAFDAWQNAVVNNAEYSLECRLRQKDGDYFWWLIRAVPIFDKKGNVIKWFGTCTDIQNIKETEIELLKAKEKAEESDRLKSAFLANMSHEIRTPMNGILGFSELLKEPGLTGEMQQEYILIIEKSGARMLNIINDIVDISKIEAGLMEVHIKESNINKQIEFIYAFFKPEIEEKGLHFLIKTTLADKEAFIKSDSEKIYSILTNLVKNAIKFTDEGTIELGYALKTKKAVAEFEFYVKDMGIGIPKNRQKAIFERFIQADISDKMARQGTGLGLSISKAYVEMLGGKIWVESEEGKGSIFYFTIPYQTEAEEQNGSDKGILSEKLGCEDNSSISRLKILAVDDNKISRLLISAILKENSKALLEASTGIEAVDISRNNADIDLILMDIQMPGLNGYEATRQIREFNTDVIIIAQSAFGLSDDREKAILAGCNDYISKPFVKVELLALINKYF